LKPLKVVTVDSVASALELLAHDREFDLILCDMMMPYKSGMDLFETAHVRWPELTARFVFMSGGVYTNRAREFLDRIDNLSLEKPLTRDDLLSVISKIDGR
jgi:DNA-binding NtrC family response regulator